MSTKWTIPSITWRGLALLTAFLAVLAVNSCSSSPRAANALASTDARLMPGTAAPAAIDRLQILNMHVTQGTQDLANSVPLLAQRSTAVRVSVVLTNQSRSVSLAGITGTLTLTGSVAGQAITGTLSALDSITVKKRSTPPASPYPNLNNEGDTLNFQFIAPNVIASLSNVVLHVDVWVDGQKASTTVSSVRQLSFEDATDPTLYFTRVNYTPTAAVTPYSVPAPQDVQAGRGDLFVKAVFPVHDNGQNLYQECGTCSPLTFTSDDGVKGKIDLATDGNELLNTLDMLLDTIVISNVGQDGHKFMYGWVPADSVNAKEWGLARLGGRVALGDSSLDHYQALYAHEFAHNLGLPDLSYPPLTDVGWDVGPRLPNNPSGNNTSGRVKPVGTTWNLLRAGLTRNTWINATTYTTLLNSLIQLGGLHQQVQLPAHVLVVRGIFDPAGNQVKKFEPAFRFPWKSQPSTDNPNGLHTIIVTDTEGISTTIRFDAKVIRDSEQGGQESEGFFSVMVPVDPNREVSSLVIVSSTSGMPQYGPVNSSSLPTITIAYPSQGAVLGSMPNIEWKVTDTDTNASDLRYQVVYSYDGGHSWVPVVVDVLGAQTAISFNSMKLINSHGEGVIRVFVSDGLNTASADVTQLTLSLGITPRPNNPILPITMTLPLGNGRFFSQTSTAASGVFLDWWTMHGDLAQLGYPISDPLGETSDVDGNLYAVQYFEKGALEYHPELQEPYRVLPALLGTLRYQAKYPNGAPSELPNTSPGSIYFPQTGKWLGGRFRQYWQSHGGVDQQGYPVSNEFTEVSDLDGKTYTVQYFQRTVFENHPENPLPNDVLLSQLGTFQYKAKYEQGK